MKEPVASYMKVGLVHFMAYPDMMKGEGPLASLVARTAQDEFFQAIEVCHIKDESERRRVKSLLEQSHMEVGFGSQPYLLSNRLDVNSLDPAARTAAIDALKLLIEEAAFLGAGKFALLSGKDPGEANRAEAGKLLVDSLCQLCAHAASVCPGLTVVLETFDRDIDKRCLVGPSTEAASIAAEVRKSFSNFGLMVDLSHLPMLGESPEHCLTAVRGYLSHVHVGNCVIRAKSHSAYGDLHPRFGIPGGENDVPELARFLRSLLATGYLGGVGRLPVVSFEVKPLPGEDSDVVVAGAKRTLLEAWAAA